MNHDWMQELNVRYQICVLLQVDSKTKMASLSSDLLKCFQLFLCNLLM